MDGAARFCYIQHEMVDVFGSYHSGLFWQLPFRSFLAATIQVFLRLCFPMVAYVR